MNLHAETLKGWLLLYHGVITHCNGFIYSMGAAILELDYPLKQPLKGFVSLPQKRSRT